jgi:K+-sensing histidine kinase KdpD
MIKPETPQNEEERLKAVESYGLLDTNEQEDFDQITEIAAGITDRPIALMTLIDTNRNWFMAHFGTNLREDPRDRSFCGHAINNPSEPLIIEDASEDVRFEDNPLVVGDTHIRFYAGFPIVNEDGYALGTICVMDTKAGFLSKKQIQIMKALANQSLVLMEGSKREIRLKKLNQELIDINEKLKNFAKTAAHDLRSPIANIKELANLLQDRLNLKNFEKEEKMLKMIFSAATQLKEMIDGILEYSGSSEILRRSQRSLQISETIQYCITLVDPKQKHSFKYPNDFQLIKSNEVALKRIFLNLFNNSIQHSYHENCEVIIDYEVQDRHYHFTVSDNGRGIPANLIDNIFDIYKRGSNSQEDKGIGLGLATVKKLVKGLGGEISVKNLKEGGAQFSFTLPK